MYVKAIEEQNYWLWRSQCLCFYFPTCRSTRPFAFRQPLTAKMLEDLVHTPSFDRSLGESFTIGLLLLVHGMKTLIYRL